MDEVLVDKLQFYGKKWFNGLSLALAVFLMFPTVAIMATWNTLPGEKLYPTKRYLENIALGLVGNNFTVRADLQTQFVEQRFNEAETLLSQSSDTGLNELLRQIQVTKTDIIEAKGKTGTKDSLVAQKKAEKLAIQLREYNVKLENTKQTIIKETHNVYVTNTVYVTTVATPKPNMSPTTTNIQTPNTPVVVPPVQTPVTNVEDAQEEIAIVIEELENVQNSMSSGGNGPNNIDAGTTNIVGGGDKNNRRGDDRDGKRPNSTAVPAEVLMVEPTTVAPTVDPMSDPVINPSDSDNN